MFYKIADDTLVASLSIIGSPIILFCLFPFVLKLQCREFGDILNVASYNIFYTSEIPGE